MTLSLPSIFTSAVSEAEGADLVIQPTVSLAERPELTHAHQGTLPQAPPPAAVTSCRCLRERSLRDPLPHEDSQPR